MGTIKPLLLFMKKATLLLAVILSLSACKNEHADGVLIIQTKYLTTNIGERPDAGATVYITPYDSAQFFYLAGFSATTSAEADFSYKSLKSKIKINEIDLEGYKKMIDERTNSASIIKALKKDVDPRIEKIEKELEQQRKDFAILEAENKLWIDTVNMEIDRMKKICTKQTADKNGVCVFTLPGGRSYCILVQSSNCIGESVFENNGKLNLRSKHVVASDTTSITVPMSYCKL